jgi:hypothetical protein
MYTSGLLLALVGLFPSSIRQEPIWLDDYSQACRQCGQLEKPLAVFIGSGAKGWNRLSKGGQLSAETQEVLSKNYICLYLDTNRKDVPELANAFEMPNRLGIVISDSKGRVQAFRHEGDMQTQVLMRNLRRYADPQRIVASTESNPSDEPPPRTYRFATPVYEAPPSYSSFRTGRSC